MNADDQSLSDDFATLMDLFIELVEAGTATESAKKGEGSNGAQILSIKFFRHLASMQMLAQRTVVQYKELSSIFFIDHSSLNVVARAAFETYLVFFFIYGQGSEELAEFRYKIWCLAGLSDRQKFYAFSKDGLEKLKNEAAQIEQLKVEVKSSPCFLAYSDKQKKELLRGKWRIGNEWAVLSKHAGFHERYFKDLYSYLCAYSHSSYLSAMQVSGARSIKDQAMLTRMTMGIGCVLMSHFAFCFSRNILASDEVLSANPKGRLIAEKYNLRAENMAFIYSGGAGLAQGSDPA